MCHSGDDSDRDPLLTVLAAGVFAAELDYANQKIRDLQLELAYARAFLTPIAGPWIVPHEGGWQREVSSQIAVARVLARPIDAGHGFLWFALPPGETTVMSGQVHLLATEAEAKAAADAALRAAGWSLRDKEG